MNIFARILSHGFSLAVVGLLIVGFIYRGELFPDLQLPGFPDREVSPIAESAPSITEGKAQQPGDDWMAGVDDATEVAASTEIEREPGQPGVAMVEETDSPEMPDAVASPSEEILEAGTTSEPEKSVEPASTESMQQATGDSTGAIEAEATQSAPVVTTETATDGDVAIEKAVEDAPETDLAGMSEKGVTETASGVQSDAAGHSPSGTTSIYRVLARAREAYWMHDYPLAESSYRRVIALSPDSPDGYGELGNLYFAKGLWDKASNEYYEAGVRLVDAGYVQEARDLLGVIKGLNGQDAGKLEAYIANSVN